MPANLQLAGAPDAARPPAAGARIRVVLVDDHALVRRSLRLLLEHEADVEIVAEAADLSSVMRHVHVHAPHVLVLDLRMPPSLSVEAIERLRQRAPRTAIIVLTIEDDPAFAERAIDAGAVAYVLKDRADTDLPEAVRRAAQGEPYVSPRVLARLSSRRRVGSDDGLTPLETEVLRLTALGQTSRQIGARLRLSARTVDNHRRRVKRKLGFASRRELVRYALRRGLLGA